MTDSEELNLNLRQVDALFARIAELKAALTEIADAAQWCSDLTYTKHDVVTLMESANRLTRAIGTARLALRSDSAMKAEHE